MYDDYFRSEEISNISRKKTVENSNIFLPENKGGKDKKFAENAINDINKKAQNILDQKKSVSSNNAWNGFCHIAADH